MASWRYAKEMVPRIAGLLLVGVAGLRAQAAPQPPNEPVALSREDVRQRHAQGKPLWDTQWRVRPDGVLEQHPNPAAGGSTANGLSFAGVDDYGERPGDPLVTFLSRHLHDGTKFASDVRNWLAPLLRHPGDLLGATDAERHFAQLGRDATDQALRQFLVVPATAATPELQRREQLDRELAVRVLQQRRVKASVGELRLLAARRDDPFLQRTAATALAALGGGAAPAPVAFAGLALKVPRHADAWLWLDCMRLPERRDVDSAVRGAEVERLWSLLERFGGKPLSIHLAGCQMHVDQFGEVPYEAARTWGRAQVDQMLVALQATASGVQLGWAAASGRFEAAVLAEYLRKRKIDFAALDGGLQTTAWWPGFEVTVLADRVVVRRDGLALGGATPGLVAKATAAGAPLAAEVPAHSPLTMPWLLLDAPGSALLSLAPFRLQIERQGDVQGVADRLVGIREQVGDWPSLGWSAVLKSDDLDVIVAAWQAALAKAEVQPAGEGRVGFVVAGAGLDPFRLWPLLW